MLEALEARHKVLHKELQNAKQSMDALNEQHEKSKIHFHVVNGHFNECGYQLMEAHKAIGQAVPPIPVESCEPVMEQDNGQVDQQVVAD